MSGAASGCVPYDARSNAGMSVISRTNQITLPVDVLRAAGLQPGDEVRVTAVGPGRLELVRLAELVDELAGIFDATVYPEGYLERLRRE
jgi:bifunctional DNA-binding transcriptional regulator/antitoxin component of YhaV-PrlF toxin-antitoxin module